MRFGTFGHQSQNTSGRIMQYLHFNLRFDRLCRLDSESGITWNQSREAELPKPSPL